MAILRPWTADEKVMLRALAEQRTPLILIAAKLRRSEGSISRVASELGIHVYSRRSLIKMAQEKSAQA